MLDAGRTAQLGSPDLPETELVTGRPAAPAKARLGVAELVRRAAEARAQQRYGDAARWLELLLEEHPDGPDAQNARVELADLSREKLGAPARALQLYDAYLRRGGPLGPEARYGKARALQSLGRARDERAAIDAFLTEHGQDFRARELRDRRTALGG
jgi:tetratricopeptide (TPR) repeat protein